MELALGIIELLHAIERFEPFLPSPEDGTYIHYTIAPVEHELVSLGRQLSGESVAVLTTDREIVALASRMAELADEMTEVTTVLRDYFGSG